MEEQTPAPLSDLSFFRFPELTSEVVRNALVLLLILVFVVGMTALAQYWIGLVKETYRKRNAVRRRLQQAMGQDAEVDEGGMDRMDGGPAPLHKGLDHALGKAMKRLVSRLLRETGLKDEYQFVTHALLFEQAVHRVLPQLDEMQAKALHRLRQVLHLNVMNPEQQLVSTRQLLQDLPIRMVASLGHEKLELNCTLLDVDEYGLVMGLPHQVEVFNLLLAHPEVLLLYWREADGETVFRISLESLGEDTPFMFKAGHTLADPATGQRASFRLAVEAPVTYHFVERGDLRVGMKDRMKEQDKAQDKGGSGPTLMKKGEGSMVDVSYGGASLVVPEPLGENGFAQLYFNLNDQPMRLMLEVLSCLPVEPGQWLLRGRFRGQGEETYHRLNNTLSREQLKRLRVREVIHFDPVN